MDLVVMSAGFGTRFGERIKQLEPIGPNGETIMEMSAIDAVNAGFDKIIFVIRKEIEELFVETVAKKLLSKGICLGYVFQDMENGVRGTVGAVLSAKEVINTKEPFGVINADDYYGKDSFELMVKNKWQERFLIGYPLQNTLSETGEVNRGICKVDTEGNLIELDEMKGITKKNAPEAIASMNMWVFNKQALEEMEWLYDTVKEGGVKELILSDWVSFDLKMAEDMTFAQPHNWKVIETNNQWVGITFEDDVPQAREALKNWKA